MNIKQFIGIASIAGATLMMAASASAAGINYTTNDPLTKFVVGGTGLTLNSTSGQAATLTFTPNTFSNVGVPSNIDLGDFLLLCGTCTLSQTTTFGAFTFDIFINDQTDNATGIFVGTSTGGIVSSNSSTINVTFAPTAFGPGTTNANSGNFGSTIFSKLSPITSIVAPNSGTPPGDTTVQAQVSSAPEPTSVILFGGGLVGLMLVRRRLFSAK